MLKITNLKKSETGVLFQLITVNACFADIE